MQYRKWLIGLLLFNSLSAIGGGLALMAKPGMFPASWIQHTAFPSLYFPGVILFAIVGGSSLVAGLSVWKRIEGEVLATIVAGVIMCIWIIGEITSIQSLHWLQIIYLATGLAVLALVYLDTNKR